MKNNWSKTSLGFLQKKGVASVQTGPFGTILKASEYSTHGVPVISVGEIRYGYLLISDRTPKVSKEIQKKLPQFVLKEGDIVFGRKGAIDRNAIISKEQAGWFLGSDGIRLRLTEKNDSTFISYQFRSSAVRKWLLQNSTGSIMPSLNQKILDRLPVWLPSIAEQKKISAILSVLDAKIDCNNRINTNLEAMARMLYDHWFVQFDFPDVSGKPYKSSGGKMSYNSTLKRQIPVGWVDKRLCQIANITMGQSPAGDSLNDTGDGIEFFQGSTDFGWQFPTVRQYTTQPARMAKLGDILLSVRAPVGDMNTANIDCCIGRGLAALNSKEGFDGFLFYVMRYFKTIFDRRNGEGTTFGSITKNDLHSLPLAYPPAELLQRYDEVVTRYNKMIVARSKENLKLAKLRDWLLPMLMNGQITVS